mmetsp:Transcript_17723/g.62424  ORF Transcript_17723/g.62424 Transcript_17723/m.62424 type:complete len:282 (-) Transcript_17723:734-1579(-)
MDLQMQSRCRRARHHPAQDESSDPIISMLRSDGTAHSVAVSRSSATGIVLPVVKLMTLFFLTSDVRRARTTSAAAAATTATPATPTPAKTSALLPEVSGASTDGAAACAAACLRAATDVRVMAGSTSLLRSSTRTPARVLIMAPVPTWRSSSFALSWPLAMRLRRRAAMSTGVEPSGSAEGLPARGTVTVKSTLTLLAALRRRLRRVPADTSTMVMWPLGTSSASAVPSAKPSALKLSALAPLTMSDATTSGSGSSEPTSEHRSAPGGHTPGLHAAKQAVL